VDIPALFWPLLGGIIGLPLGYVLARWESRRLTDELWEIERERRRVMLVQDMRTRAAEYRSQGWSARAVDELERAANELETRTGRFAE
jgi:hypothetical protein